MTSPCLPSNSPVDPVLADPWYRAALLRQLRTPARVRRALVDGHAVLTPAEVLRARDGLLRRGLRPWIPWNPVAAPVLVVAGEVPAEAGVAVVGTRASDPYGLACAARVAEDAVALGVPVVSGGAEGCDAAAHQAALGAGGVTVAVLPCGHDRPYPTAHRGLFDAIARARGAVVSPWWPDTPPARHRFLGRNVVIAALARVTVVARAGRRSGALSTAAAARRLGLPVLAVPGDVGEALGEGGNALLAAGATAVTGRADLARALGVVAAGVWPVVHVGSGAPWGDGPDEAAPSGRCATGPAREVLEALEALGPSDLDSLLAHTSLPVATLSGALLDGEVSGWIERLPAQRYRLGKGQWR